jgi:hypothetical protein
MLNSAPSVTIAANRLMATPLRATALWPGAGHIARPQDGPRGDGRHRPHYHPLGAPSITIYIYGDNLNTALILLSLAGAIATV